MYRRPGRAERMARGMFSLDGTAAGVMAGMTLELDDERVCPQTTTVAAALAHHRSATIGETGTVCCALHELQARRLVPRTGAPPGGAQLVDPHRPERGCFRGDAGKPRFRCRPEGPTRRQPTTHLLVEQSGHQPDVTRIGASSSHVDPPEGTRACKRRLSARSHSSAIGSTACDWIGERLSEYRCRLVGLRHFRDGSRIRFV